MTFVKKNIKPLIFIVIVFVFSFLIVISNFRFLLHAGGDHASYINPNILRKQTKNTWDENSLFMLGGFSYGDLSSFAYILPFKILSFLPVFLRQYIYFALFFSLTFLVSFYYFKTYLFKETFPSLFAALFYFLNLYLFSSFVNVPNQFLIVVLPLLLVLCHCVVEGNLSKMFVSLIISSIFIPGAFVNIPNGIPIVLLVFLYFVFTIIKEKKTKDIKKIILYSLIAIFGLLFLNSWWFASLVNALFGHSEFGMIKERTVEFFSTTSLHDAFRFLGGWSFNDYFSSPQAGIGSLFVKNPFFVFLSYLIITLSFCSFLYIKREKSVAFFLFLAFLGLSLAKGTLNPWGDLYWYSWKNIPGMFSFRTPHSKFMIIYMFPISCLLGYFAISIFKIVKPKTTKIIKICLIMLVLIIAVPFFFGGFVNRVDGGLSRSFMIKIPDYMWEYRKLDSSDKLDYRYMIFPEANGAKAYNWEKGFNTVFSKMIFFSERATIQNNQYRFDKGDEMAFNIYKIFDYFDQHLLSQDKNIKFSEWKPALLLGILNVRLFIQENDLDWRYQNSDFSTRSPSEVTRMFDILQKNNIITKKAEFGKFDSNYLSKIPDRVTDNWLDGSILSPEQKQYLKNLLPKELKDRPALNLYSLNKELFVPHLYIPENIIITGGPMIKYYNALELNDYSKSFGFFFIDKNNDKYEAIKLIKELEKKGENYLPEDVVLEYRKIGPSKYKVVLHQAKGIVPIIFSDTFDKEWKLYINKAQNSPQNPPAGGQNYNNLTLDYKILDDNNEDQATKEELASYIEKGWISTLGNLKKRKINHYTFAGGAETIDYTEKYNIDFISKNFKRTIQNNNIKLGYFWDTWFPANGTSLFKRNDLYQLGEENHLNANGVVNSWVLDIDEICSSPKLEGFCKRNSNGSFDLEMVTEFEPQKIFHLSVAISILTLSGVVVFLLMGCLKHKTVKYYNE